MTKKLIIASLCVFLTSCANTDGVSSNKHKADIPSGTGSGAYSKFTLPDMENIPTVDELYTFELEYINKNSDENTYRELLQDLETAAGTELGGEPEITKSGITHDGNGIRIRIRGFSAPYCHFHYSAPADLNSKQDIKYVQLADDNSEDIKNCVKSAGDLERNVYSALGDGLTSKPSEAYTFNIDGKKFTEVFFQKYYKGVGIQALTAHSPDPDHNQEGNSVLALYFSYNALMDENNQVYSFSGPDSFIVTNAKKLEDTISFQTACEILEENLSDNIHFDFKDVRLWYEPHGMEPSASDTASLQNIICTPKWYFIVDNIIENDYHSIDYVTVDCQNGEIHVLIP